MSVISPGASEPNHWAAPRKAKGTIVTGQRQMLKSARKKRKPPRIQGNERKRICRGGVGNAAGGGENESPSEEGVWLIEMSV